MRTHLFLALVASMFLFGCSAQRVGGVVAAKGAQTTASGSTGGSLAVNPDRSTFQHYASENPSAVMATPSGVESYGPVPYGTVGVTLPDETYLLASVPNDFSIDTVDLTLADGSLVRLGGVSISTSDVVVARAEFLTQMFPIIQAMTQAQKESLLAQYEAQAATGDAIAQGLLPILRALVGAP